MGKTHKQKQVVRQFLQDLANDGAVAAGVVLVMEDGTTSATGINIERHMLDPMRTACCDLTTMVSGAFRADNNP